MSTTRIDIVSKGDRWIAQGRKHREIASDDSKSSLVKKVARDARDSGKATVLRIHKRNGHLQEERTYPSASAARRSKR